MIAVQFIKHHGVYNPGEVAGFDDATAGALIAARVAVAQADAEALAGAEDAPPADAPAVQPKDPGAVAKGKPAKGTKPPKKAPATKAVAAPVADETKVA